MADDAANAYGNGNGNAGGDGGSGPGRSMRVTVIAITVAIVALVAGAVGVYAYDESRRDQIADGVRVEKVDLGGLDREQATKRLQRRIAAPLQRPLRVKLNKLSFKLLPAKAKLRVNVEAMVDEAIEVSQDGGLPGRTFRYLTGGEVDERVRPTVSYSGRAVDRFVDGIADQVNREPQDASISATGTSLNVVAALNGRALRGEILRRQIAAALESGSASHMIKASAVRQKPEVSTREVASEYPVYLTVDRGSYTTRLWKNLKLVNTYTIAVGQSAYPTPSGLFSVQSKQVDPVWSVPNSPWAGELAGTTVAGGSAENPLRARWMGVTDGVGFHGTDETYSLGSAASHGCLRMSVPDVIALYDQVPVGTPVYIG